MGVTVLRYGAKKPNPFTICFIANPVLSSHSNELSPDPICGNKSLFDITVSRFVGALLDGVDASGVKIAETLISQTSVSSSIKALSVFSPGLSIINDNCLVQEDGSSYLNPIPERVAFFTNNLGLVVDVVFVISSSALCKAATSSFTTDDSAQAEANYVLDGTNGSNGLFCTYAGVSAIHSTSSGITAVHEFCHAVSADGARIADLYNYDDDLSNIINKKNMPEPVPPKFCTYQGHDYVTEHQSDLFPTKGNNASYFSSRVDAAFPPLMGDYLHCPSPQSCRHDSFTYQFLLDRLSAKVNR